MTELHGEHSSGGLAIHGPNFFNIALLARNVHGQSLLILELSTNVNVVVRNGYSPAFAAVKEFTMDH